MLHYVSDDKSLNDLQPWVITHNSYIRLLDFLTDNRYKAIGFNDIDGPDRALDKRVIITFDDCPKHLWDFAIPELQKRNMKAVFYMPTAHLGGVNEWNASDGMSKVELMDEQDMKELVSIGMEVGSHAHDHIMLEELPLKQVQKQLKVSKERLEKLTGKSVNTIAYPYGSIPDKHKKLSSEAGYKYALGVNVTAESKYAIRRWIYSDHDSVADIKWKLSKGYRYYRFLSDNYNYYKRHILSSLYNKYAKVKNNILRKVPVVFAIDELGIDIAGFTGFCDLL